MANDESDAAVERLLPSQRVESLGGEELGLGAAGEGAADEAGGHDESGTAVSIRPSSSASRASAPRRSWFGGKRANKGAPAAAATANGRPAPSGQDAPTRSEAGGAFRDRDRLLDSDDVRLLLSRICLRTNGSRTVCCGVLVSSCLVVHVVCLCARISVVREKHLTSSFLPRRIQGVERAIKELMHITRQSIRHVIRSFVLLKEMPLPMGPGAPAIVSGADANSRLALSLPPAPDVPAARANQAGTQATGMTVLRAGTSSSATHDLLVDGSDDDEVL